MSDHVGNSSMDNIQASADSHESIWQDSGAREKLWFPVEASVECPKIATSDTRAKLHYDSKCSEGAILTTESARSSKTISVYLRLRPFPSDAELTSEEEDAYKIVNSTTLLTKFPGLDTNTRSLKNLHASDKVCRRFTFTKTFGPEIGQMQLFDEAIRHRLNEFLGGENLTVMSYGTSNSGKSYTLNGTPSSLGMIPLSISYIFANIKRSFLTPRYKPIDGNDVVRLSSTEISRELEYNDVLISSISSEMNSMARAYESIREAFDLDETNVAERYNDQTACSIWVSFAEIYNETIYDLLTYDDQKKSPALRMVTDKRGRTFIKNLRMVYANSGDEAYAILLAGQSKSRIAATNINSRSSRSHCITTVKLLRYSPNDLLGDIEVIELSFGDLAGCGRMKMTSDLDERLEETRNINSSFLVLGRCLKFIREGQSCRQKSEAVGPFRESKLTRLFQRALSGKERIDLIVNVNPVPSLYSETKNVLNFSAIAKRIVVEPAKALRKYAFASRFFEFMGDNESKRAVVHWDGVSDELKNPDYVHREHHDVLLKKYENLKRELAELQKRALERDFQTRKEMADTCAGLITDLNEKWKNRTRSVEERQEHLLGWSVRQVENYYKEKLSRVNSRKRRRWDNGDGIDDQETEIKELEAENASLLSKIVASKETIHDLRAGKDDAEAAKNEAIFALALAREEMVSVEKRLEAAENDIRCDANAACSMEELKNQLLCKQDRIKYLKDLVNEAKEKYVEITSEARLTEEQLREAKMTLLENAEKIHDLEDQLNRSNSCLAQQAKSIEIMTAALEMRTEQLLQADPTAPNGKIEESHSVRQSSRLFSQNVGKRRTSAFTDISRLRSPQRALMITRQDDDEITRIESENSLHGTPIWKNRSLMEFESIEEQCSIDSIAENDSRVEKERGGSRMSYSEEDSGIAVSADSGNHSNCTDDTGPELKEQFDDPIRFLRQLSRELANAREQMVASKSERETVKLESMDVALQSVGTADTGMHTTKLTDVINDLKGRVEEYEARIESFGNDTRIGRERKKLWRKDSGEKLLAIERRLLSEGNAVETTSTSRFNEHGTKIRNVGGEIREMTGTSGKKWRRRNLRFDEVFRKNMNALVEKGRCETMESKDGVDDFRTANENHRTEFLENVEILPRSPNQEGEKCASRDAENTTVISNLQVELLKSDSEAMGEREIEETVGKFIAMNIREENFGADFARMFEIEKTNRSIDGASTKLNDTETLMSGEEDPEETMDNETERESIESYEEQRSDRNFADRSNRESDAADNSIGMIRDVEVPEKCPSDNARCSDVKPLRTKNADHLATSTPTSQYVEIRSGVKSPPIESPEEISAPSSELSVKVNKEGSSIRKVSFSGSDEDCWVHPGQNEVFDETADSVSAEVSSVGSK